MNLRRTTLLIAIILAIGTGWLTLNYLSGIQSQNSGSNSTRSIVVASIEIPARAPITASMLVRATRPASAVEPDAIVDPKAIVGSFSLITIPAGSTITSSKIAQSANAALPVRLTPGMRAVSIQIDRVKGVSGMVQPGDRVDVIAIPPRVTDQPPPAATILRGVRVLALGDTLETSSVAPTSQESNATTMTLEVTPAQADLLAMADVDATLRLALRSPREPVGSRPPEILRFPAVAAAVAANPPSASADPPARAYSQLSGVTVIDGQAGGDSSGGSSEP
jgi:pilus assembly protein CpaB